MGQITAVALTLGLAITSVATLQAASTTTAGLDISPVTSRITKYCDPVCEVQTQDSAFSLVIEAYRQFQSRQIQIDYESRLRAAAGLGKEADTLVIDTKLNSAQTMRAWIEVLAEKERQLRLQQLQTRVANFTTAYHCARKGDEEAIQETVANKVDVYGAAQQLKTLRVLTVGSPVNANFQEVASTPAADMFLDSAPVPVRPEDLVGPCDDASIPITPSEPAQ
jgi:methylaspartate ammonia-lyase